MIAVEKKNIERAPLKTRFQENDDGVGPDPKTAAYIEVREDLRIGKPRQDSLKVGFLEVPETYITMKAPLYQSIIKATPGAQSEEGVSVGNLRACPSEPEGRSGTHRRIRNATTWCKDNGWVLYSIVVIYFLYISPSFAEDPFQGIKEGADPLLNFIKGPFAYIVMFVAIVVIGIMWMMQRFNWTIALIVLLGGVLIGQAPRIASAIIGYGG